MSEKTEEASPKRLRDARQRGQVATSRDAVTAAALLGALGALMATAGGFVSLFRAALAPAVRAASERAPHGTGAALQLSFSLAAHALLAPLAAGALAAALLGALLTGFLVAPDAAVPKLERLNPFESLKRYAKPRTYVEPLVQLLKGAVLLWLGWSAARALLPFIFVAPRAGVAGFQPARAICAATSKAVARSACS